MTLFKNKYRIESARHQYWNYGYDSAYFITICTKDRIPYFGKIIHGKLNYSPIGAIAYAMWYEITNHAKNVKLGEFVVMPDHIHGILILDGNDPPRRNNACVVSIPSNVPSPSNVRRISVVPSQTDVPSDIRCIPDVSSPRIENNARVFSNTPVISNFGQQRFQNQGKNTISSMVGGYKSAVSKYVRRMGFEFYWQPLFHDHIIRNKFAFDNISRYIQDNPKNWIKKDR